LAAACKAPVRFCTIAGATELGHKIRIAQCARNRCERVQMFRADIGRQQHEKDDIDRLGINSVEPNWLL
jgi:hypothetical protein